MILSTAPKKYALSTAEFWPGVSPESDPWRLVKGGAMPWLPAWALRLCFRKPLSCAEIGRPARLETRAAGDFQGFVQVFMTFMIKEGSLFFVWDLTMVNDGYWIDRFMAHRCKWMLIVERSLIAWIIMVVDNVIIYIYNNQPYPMIINLGQREPMMFWLITHDIQRL